ncbi:MAG: site-specific integrase [Lachnospiraceae bacterium]|nr:site-specific integrase [Lachnospiraceae bacterium]
MASGKDLTGLRFGRLTVTGRAGYAQERKQRVGMWACVCDCRNTCLAAGYRLQNGTKKSCGCLAVSSRDLTGRRYGRLTVLGLDPEDKTTRRKVICRCDCGKELSVPFRSLREGKVTSCGCDWLKPESAAGDFRERDYDSGKEEKLRVFLRGESSVVETLDDWVYIWLREVLPQIVKETTIQLYADTMERHILNRFGWMRLEEITAEKVGDWLSELRSGKDGDLTEGTVRNTLSVLSGCLRDAQKHRLIDENPCTRLAWLPEQKNLSETCEWLDDEQLSLLEPYLADYRGEDGYPLGIGYLLVLRTGISMSEAAALRWKDVNTSDRQLYIRYFVVKHPVVVEDRLKSAVTATGDAAVKIENLERVSGRRRRTVPVPRSTSEELARLQAEYHAAPEDFVLRAEDGGPVTLDRMSAALRRRAKLAGIERPSLRMLRDTYAMRAVQAGATSDMIAELMGFASPQQVIRRYMPRAAASREELVEKLYR